MISGPQPNTSKQQQPAPTLPPMQTSLPINDQTPSKSPRNHRIFREASPRESRNQSISPPPKMMASQTTFDNGSSSRQKSPFGCVMYYNESIGLSRNATSSSLQNSMSPQKLRLAKSTQILQYENALLAKQLQQRDDVIRMYKSGWAPHTHPINDGVVKNINLQLSQKNVLIEQIHRNLAEFQQVIRKDNVQVSAVCMQRFRVLQQLVMKHDHYPVLIRERVIDTSKSAQKIIIREQSHVREWQIKLQNSYKQLNTIRDRLSWFERQNNILESTIAGIKMQKDGSNEKELNALRVDVQKFRNQIIIFEQEISNYKLQIVQLNTSIKELHQHYQKLLNQAKSKDNTGQINGLKNQIDSMQKTIYKYELEIKSLTEIIEKYRFEAKAIADRQSQYLRQIEELKRNINKEDDRSLQHQAAIAEINKNYGFKISQLEKELNILRLKTKQMEKQRQINLDQIQKWKKHLEEAQVYIGQLLQEINGYKAQIDKNKKQMGEVSNLSSQNIKLSSEISNLKIAIEKIRSESDRLRAQIQQLNANGQQYKIQINEYSLKIQTLTKQRQIQSTKWQGILNQNNNENSVKIRQLQQQIEQLKRQINSVDKNKSRQWQDKYNALKRQTDSLIDQLKIQVQNLKKQINDLSQKKQNESKVSQQSIIKIRQQYELTISNLRGEIQNLKNQINLLNNTKNDDTKRYQQRINKMSIEYEQRIRIMSKQLEEYKLQIKNQKNTRDWEKQMSQLKTDYQRQLNDLWEKLKNAQVYIERITQQNSVKIAQFQKIITELKIQIEKISRQKISEEYMYKVDARYEEIRKKLIALSSKNTQAINSQSQFWQAYRQKRKKDLEDMQSTINQSLEIMTHIQQTVIVKRTELHRLDLTKLEEIVTEINKIKNDKKQLKGQVREQIQTKFYGLLKSVSTQISQ